MESHSRDGQPGPDRLSGSAFGRLAGLPDAPLDRMLLSLASEFRPVDRQAADERLDELALPLFGMASRGPEQRGRELVRVLVLEAGFAPAGPGIDALMFDRVLACRRGHPALLAAVFAEVARRAGVAVGLLSDGTDWYAGVEDEDELVLVATGPARADWNGPPGVRRRCTHELCHVLLSELAVALEIEGNLAASDHAVWLRTLLPVTGPLPRSESEEEGG